MNSTGYQATEEDVANVIASNELAAPFKNGKKPEDLAAELFPRLDFERIEEAALMGDDLDQQTEYADDEIARQLRVFGVLTPLAA